MNLDDSGKRATIQLRASQFVKRLGGFGGRKHLAVPISGGRTRSSSMDIPRKPFTTPSQPALHETSSDISSTESMRHNDSGHKRGLSMPLWSQHPEPTSSPHPSQGPPGIVVTQHLSDTHSDFDRSSAKGSATGEAPTAWTSPSSALLSAAVPDSTNTTTAHGSVPCRDVLSPAPSISKAPAGPLPQHPSHQSDSTSRISSDAARPRGEVDTRPVRNIEPRAPELTPLLRPWTPPASAAGFSLGAVPSGAISPMSLGSPIVTPPSAATPAPTLPAPSENSKTRRSPVPRLTNFPAPAFSSSPHSPLSRHEIFDKEGHLLRLSPAIIQRAPPWPIKNLPSLPPTASAAMPPVTRTLTALQQQHDNPGGTRRSTLAPPSGARRPSPSRLSSMPALPMSGSVRPQVRERDPARRATVDPEPREPGDSPELAHDMDEDEMEEMEGEQTGGDYFGRPSTSMDDRDDIGRPSIDSIVERRAKPQPESMQQLPDVDQTPFSLDALGWDTDTASFITARTSPRPESGYFSFEPQLAQSSTPRPGNFSKPDDPHRTPRVGGAKKHRPSPLTPSVPGSHPFHSMVDLRMSIPQSAPPPIREWEEPSAPAEERVRKRMSVARRQSMPSLNALPPAYTPRDDEEDSGCDSERLPEYSNSIRLVAQMPRKLEFSAPGELSRDRKWRRVWCVLEGTKFSVYRVKGVKSVWEGVVGAGDGTVYRNMGKGKGKMDEREEGLVRKVEEETRVVQEEERRSFSRQRSASPSASTFLIPPGGSDHPRAGSSTSNLSSRSNGTASTRSSVPLRTRLGRVASSSSLSLAARSEGDSPDPSLLLREYTLQHAESGLGSDYTKRKNVIRVRMEGEQFLLQAKDVEDVVEWIEGFQAASDIALDLDERKMPRGPLFPRRRRRRRPRPSEEEEAPAPTNTS